MVFNKISKVILFMVVGMFCQTLSAQKTDSSKGTGGPTSTQPAGSSNQGGGGTPFFETQMLAYGALDQTMRALARRACLVGQRLAADAQAPLIVVMDQTSLTSLEAYDSFYSTARFLKISFDKLAGVSKPAAAGADTFADITGAVATVLVASNSESGSTVTIQDPSAAIKLAFYLPQDTACQSTGAVTAYPGMYGGDLSEIENTFTKLSTSRNLAFQAIPPAAASTTSAAAAFNNLDASYNQFLQSLFAINSATGQSGLAPIIQGYGMRRLLQSEKRQVYEVYVNVAAAGGTQRVRKNAVTALLTGDWIAYSGGVVVNAVILKMTEPSALLYANVLRYRTPLAHISAPQNKNSTQYGDNLGDTCLKGDTVCQNALSNQK